MFSIRKIPVFVLLSSVPLIKSLTLLVMFAHYQIYYYNGPLTPQNGPFQLQIGFLPRFVVNKENIRSLDTPFVVRSTSLSLIKCKSYPLWQYWSTCLTWFYLFSPFHLSSILFIQSSCHNIRPNTFRSLKRDFWQSLNIKHNTEIKNKVMKRMNAYFWGTFRGKVT